MGIRKGKTEGGSGGKRGHSNMDHWVTTEEIKTASRKRRRLEAKKLIVSELASELEEAERKGKARRENCVPSRSMPRSSPLSPPNRRLQRTPSAPLSRKTFCGR